MADSKGRPVLDDFSGGRNGSDPPLGPTFAANQVVDAVNGDWYRTAGFRKRHGSTNISMTGSGWVGPVSWLGRHTPGTVEANAELWGVDEASPATFQRLDNSATWTTPASSVDVPTAASSPWDMTSASLNGFFFIAYDSGVARLHLYEASTDSVRRTGVATVTPGTWTAAQVADQGAGAYAAVKRWYRLRFLALNGAAFVRRSDPGNILAFTPSGAGASVRINQPTVPAGEGITHWEIEASDDGVTFYVLRGFAGGNQLAIGTTLYDDTAAYPIANAGLSLSPLTGTYTVQTSYRFLAADQNRLLGFGSYISTDKQSRLWISAVVGSRDEGDAERVDTTSTYYYDFDEKDSGIPTGLIGPLFGNFYPLKTRQIWELSPTGIVSDPYRKFPISKELGCVSSHAAHIGEDARGQPCLYLMTHRGVYRYGRDGLTYIGRGIEDLILGPTSVMNMAATKVISHLVYHQDKRQLWVWFATGSSNEADTLCVLDVMGGRSEQEGVEHRPGGWARFTGTMAQARCSVMFARSIGATMGFALTPYIGSTTAVNRVTRCDDTAVTQDAGVNYQAYLTTKPLQPAGPGMRGEFADAIVLAPAASGVTLTATIIPDFGAQPTKTGTALLTASAAGESRVSKRLEDSALGGAEFLQITIGDGAAANNTWSIDRLIVPVGGSEPVS